MRWRYKTPTPTKKEARESTTHATLGQGKNEQRHPKDVEEGQNAEGDAGRERGTRPHCEHRKPGDGDERRSSCRALHKAPAQNNQKSEKQCVPVMFLY